MIPAPADVTLFYELLEVAERSGAVEAGAVAEAALRGVAMAITHIAGPQAAYAVMQRVADAAAGPLLQTGPVG